MDESKPVKICADIDAEMGADIIAKNYNLRGSKIMRLDGYDDLNFHLIPPISLLDSRTKSNIWPHGYTLKIINWELSENTIFITEYINVLLHLNKEGISCPRPIKNKFDEYSSYLTSNGRKHVIILLTYQDGEELQKLRCDKNISVSLGQFMSKLHLHLEPFRSSEAFRRPEFPWSLEAIPRLRNLLNVIDVSKERRDLILSVIHEFEDRVLSKLDCLEKGVIHNDLNDRNLLTKRLADNNQIEFGIIDFTDMVYTAYLFEFAITACYLCLNNPDEPTKLVASLLAGYERRCLTGVEYELLKICICARLVQSLVMGLYAYSLNPGNEYTLETQKLGWKLLYIFYDMDNESFKNELGHKNKMT